MTSSTTDSSAQRSTFVTVLAWLVIIMAGFSTFIAVLQNIMISTVMPIDQIPSPSWPEAEHMPTFMRFMMANIRWFFVVFLAMSAATLVSAIGLLRREEWARRVFTGLLGLGILWNVAGIFIQQSMFGSPTMVPATAQPEIRADFERMIATMMVFSVVLALAISALFAWLIKRLNSASIRAEFGSAP